MIEDTLEPLERRALWLFYFQAFTRLVYFLCYCRHSHSSRGQFDLFSIARDVNSNC